MAGEKEEIKEIEIPPVEEVKPPEGYSIEEWMGLSAGSRAVILEEIENPEGEAPEITDESLKEIAGEDEAAKKKADEEASALVDKEKSDEEAAKIAGEKPPADGKKPLTDEELLAFKVKSDVRIDPNEEVPIPGDLQNKLNEIEAKFEEGEIDLKEYNTLVRAIDRQATARFLDAKKDLEGTKVWETEQKVFLGSRPEYLGEKQADGTFQATTESSIKWGALGKAFDSLQKENPNLSGMELLIKADRMVKKMLGGVESPAPAPLKKGDEKPPAKMPDDFVTLGDIPAAGKNSTEGTFDQLDKLSGKKLEAYMAKHPDLVDRYINDLG
jgi:hypothetical protein